MITLSIDKELALSGSTVIPNVFIAEHFASAPDDFIKVYIYALMQLQNPAFSNDDMAYALNITEARMMEAFKYWSDRGLVRILGGEPAHIEFLKPQSHIIRTVGEKGRYDDLLTALREVMGTRAFNTTELRTLYDWIEVFGLSEDVVVKLVTYCMDMKGRNVSVKYMNSVAKSWAEQHLYTIDELDEYLAQQQEYMGRVRDIKKRWRLSRNITEDELELYKKWSEQWHIPHEVIMEACADSVHASTPSFAYLDKVLEGYRERGTVDIEAIDIYKKRRSATDEIARQLFLKAGLKRKPTLQQRDRVDTWINDWRIPREALMLLSEKASSVSKPFEYMAKVAASWNERDIRNVEDARNDLNNSRQEQKYASKRLSPKYDYPQHRYTTEDLIKLGIDLGINTPSEKNDPESQT